MAIKRKMERETPQAHTLSLFSGMAYKRVLIRVSGMISSIRNLPRAFENH
jgi:hypothetical protein